MHLQDSLKACEGSLKRHKAYNTEHNIHASHNFIIDHILERGLELQGEYEEIYGNLKGPKLDRDLDVFFDGLVFVAATWNPVKVAKSREDRRLIKQVNRKIAKVAEHLAFLLEEREMLNNHSGFASETHYDICQVIEETSAGNHLFDGWVKEPLAELKFRFDMKYWPSLAECVRTISVDADDPEILPTNTTTAAATKGGRAGDADFFKAFNCRLREEGLNFPNLHPSSLKLSNPALAVLASAALGRTDDEMFDADYVKRLRQRERQASDTCSARITG